MNSNIYSNFEHFIATLNGDNVVSQYAVFKSRRFRNMTKSISLMLKEERHPYASSVVDYAHALYELLVQDQWTTTDRDLFETVMDTLNAVTGDAWNVDMLNDIVRSWYMLPMDVEGNGTPSRRYKEAVLAGLDLDRKLYEVAGALAVFVYVYVHITHAFPLPTSGCFIKHHWRTQKSSFDGSLYCTLAIWNPQLIQKRYRLRIEVTERELTESWLRLYAAAFAEVYSRLYVPAVLGEYGSPVFRSSYKKLLEGRSF
jgi:hypothetical protein